MYPRGYGVPDRVSRDGLVVLEDERRKKSRPLARENGPNSARTKTG